MKLPGKQLERIHLTLLDGFTPESLRRMVRVYLDVSLQEQAGGATFSDQVWSLVEWAEKNGKLPDLINGAHTANPDNVEIRSLYNESQSWFINGQHVYGQPVSAAEATYRQAQHQPSPNLIAAQTATKRAAVDKATSKTGDQFTGCSYLVLALILPFWGIVVGVRLRQGTTSRKAGTTLLAIGILCLTAWTAVAWVSLARPW
ncbi:MAG: effector-associated domain EAD1-containing protein [Caldilineaceae bacterium]